MWQPSCSTIIYPALQFPWYFNKLCETGSLRSRLRTPVIELSFDVRKSLFFAATEKTFTLAVLWFVPQNVTLSLSNWMLFLCVIRFLDKVVASATVFWRISKNYYDTLSCTQCGDAVSKSRIINPVIYVLLKG